MDGGQSQIGRSETRKHIDRQLECPTVTEASRVQQTGGDKLGETILGENAIDCRFLGCSADPTGGVPSPVNTSAFGQQSSARRVSAGESVMSEDSPVGSTARESTNTGTLMFGVETGTQSSILGAPGGGRQLTVLSATASTSESAGEAVDRNGHAPEPATAHQAYRFHSPPQAYVFGS